MENPLLTTPAHLNPDRPIEKIENDRLGRAGFARSVASVIRNRVGPDADSLVIALYGPWGCGKSSVKNMILRVLEAEEKDHRPIIVEFNPWQCEGLGQISQTFFREIATALEQEDKSEGHEKRAQNWKVYSACFKLGTTMAKELGESILPFLLPGAAPFVEALKKTKSLDSIVQGASDIFSAQAERIGSTKPLFRLAPCAVRLRRRPAKAARSKTWRGFAPPGQAA